MSFPSFEAARAGYTNLWRTMKVRPEKRGQLQTAARKILQGKSRYMAVEKRTGVPWFVIGLEHYREADCSFACHLHNGDNGHPNTYGWLTVRTHSVPPNRPTSPPPWTWEDSARDALAIDGLDKIASWDVARIGYMTEKFNGGGYYDHNVNSPYVWAGSNHYGDPNDPEQHGKYIRDHDFDPTYIDTQLGCMPTLAVMMELDSSISLWLAGKSPAPAPEPTPPQPTPQPQPPKPRPPAPTPAPSGGILSWLLKALFKWPF